jgi:ribosomal protein L12E/L44/L45/RPP1/RPP2
MHSARYCGPALVFVLFSVGGHVEHAHLHTYVYMHTQIEDMLKRLEEEAASAPAAARSEAASEAPQERRHQQQQQQQQRSPRGTAY